MVLVLGEGDRAGSATHCKPYRAQSRDDSDKTDLQSEDVYSKEIFFYNKARRAHPKPRITKVEERHPHAYEPRTSAHRAAPKISASRADRRSGPTPE